jgi:hypothetical protein
MGVAAPDQNKMFSHGSPAQAHNGVLPYPYREEKMMGGDRRLVPKNGSIEGRLPRVNDLYGGL